MDLSTSNNERAWHRRHVSTYIVVLLTAAVLVLLNVPGQRTAEFGVYPYEPWRDRSTKDEDSIVIVAFNTRQIQVNHLLLHGWPKTWLVRDVTGHDDAETGEPRDTRIWSFTEDLRQFYPGWLAVNVAVAVALTAATGLLFESWRRRRLWQQTIGDWLVLIAAVGAATAFALKAARDYREERAALSAIELLSDDNLVQSLFESFGRITRTSGGPSWLRELLGESWRPWLSRTVQLDIRAEHLDELSRLPKLRALRVQDLRLDDESLSVLSSLKRLELLRLERVYDNSPPSQNGSGPNNDLAVAQLLGYLDSLNRLEVLRLDNCAFGDESARATAALSMLRILIVNDAAAFTDDGLAALAECKGLEVLDLRGGNRVTGDGLRHLSSLPHLHSLKVERSTGLDDSVIDALKMLPALEKFSANCSRMTAAGIERFAELPHLHGLTLNNVSHHSAISRLKEKRPDMHVISDYSVPGRAMNP